MSVCIRAASGQVQKLELTLTRLSTDVARYFRLIKLRREDPLTCTAAEVKGESGQYCDADQHKNSFQVLKYEHFDGQRGTTISDGPSFSSSLSGGLRRWRQLIVSHGSWRQAGGQTSARQAAAVAVLSSPGGSASESFA